MKTTLFILLVILGFGAKAQKVESIYFNLYTDSLKKGVHNYINVDGKLDNGNYLPLTSKEVKFWSCGGKWDGNNLILDSSYSADSVIIYATLIKNPSLSKSVTIYLKKNLEQPALKSEKELLEGWRKKKKGK